MLFSLSFNILHINLTIFRRFRFLSVSIWSDFSLFILFLVDLQLVWIFNYFHYSPFHIFQEHIYKIHIFYNMFFCHFSILNFHYHIVYYIITTIINYIPVRYLTWFIKYIPRIIYNYTNFLIFSLFVYTTVCHWIINFILWFITYIL